MACRPRWRRQQACGKRAIAHADRTGNHLAQAARIARERGQASSLSDPAGGSVRVGCNSPQKAQKGLRWFSSCPLVLPFTLPATAAAAAAGSCRLPTVHHADCAGH